MYSNLENIVELTKIIRNSEQKNNLMNCDALMFDIYLLGQIKWCNSSYRTVLRYNIAVEC